MKTNTLNRNGWENKSVDRLNEVGMINRSGIERSKTKQQKHLFTPSMIKSYRTVSNRLEKRSDNYLTLRVWTWWMNEKEKSLAHSVQLFLNIDTKTNDGKTWI